MLVFLVIGVGFMGAGLGSFLLSGLMVNKLNPRLSPDQQFSPFFWSFGKYRSFRSAYRAVFPGDPLLVWWDVVWWGPLVLFLIALAAFILLR